MTGTQTLQGWKEIAAWLGRDERTAKRWEKQRGLPVRRTPGSGRANVFCIVSELEAWLTSAAPDSPGTVAEPTPTPTPPEPTPALASPTPEPPPPASAEPLPATTLSTPRHPARSHLVAAAVAAVLLLTLALSSTQLVLHSRRPIPNHVAPPQARELALQAGYLLEQRTPASLAQARTTFEAALRLDPASPAAYAGLAQTFLLLREYSGFPQQEAYQRAEQAANHALALDPNLADAHAALGFIDFFFHWSPASAEQHFRTATRLDPHCGIAHHWYGSMLLHQGRFEQSIAELNQARALQPSSPAILATTVLALGLGGHREAALQLAHTSLTLQPESISMHRALAVISLVRPRDLPTYLTALRRFSTITQDPHALALLNAGEPAFRSGGEPALWRAMLAREQLLNPSPTFTAAALHAIMGQNTLALDDLATLADRRDPGMIGLAMDPMLSDLRSSGQLTAVAHRMHLTLAADRELLAADTTLPPSALH